MSDSVNYGISGVQNLTAQNLAIGPNSRIEQSDSVIEQSNWSEALADPLAELARAVDAFEGPSTAREALLAAQTDIARELEVPAPSKSRLLAKLDSLKDLAGPAVTVVQAAAVLAQTITMVL